MTASIVRETGAGGSIGEQTSEQTLVRKVLTSRNLADTPPEWRARTELIHWNYWRREAEVYASPLNAWLAGTGVRFARLLDRRSLAGEEQLVLEDVQGRTGATLTEADYVSICAGWGRAQGQMMREQLPACQQLPWFSKRFLRHYTQSKPVNYQLLDNDSAWLAPLIRNNWPAELREGLEFLHAHAETLYCILESAPAVPCHLDFWPNNVFVDDGGSVVLIDLGFWGWGSFAEDVGNFVPDAVFDNFLAPQRFGDVTDAVFGAYADNLIDAYPQAACLPLQHYLHASAVKYVWLGPLLLERAQQTKQQSYGGAKLEDANSQYHARGMALLRLCEWAQRAVAAERRT